MYTDAFQCQAMAQISEAPYHLFLLCKINLPTGGDYFTIRKKSHPKSKPTRPWALFKFMGDKYPHYICCICGSINNVIRSVLFQWFFFNQSHCVHLYLSERYILFLICVWLLKSVTCMCNVVKIYSNKTQCM